MAAESGGTGGGDGDIMFYQENLSCKVNNAKCSHLNKKFADDAKHSKRKLGLKKV